MNGAVLFLSLSTIIFSMAAFRAMEDQSFQNAIVVFVVAGLAWAAGAVAGYLVPALRQTSTPPSRLLRWSALGVFAISALAWPWVGVSLAGSALVVVALFASGVLVPSIIGLKYEESTVMRDAFAKSLLGSSLGALLSAALIGWRGPGALFVIAASVALLAPVFESAIFFNLDRNPKRWMMLPLAAIGLGLSFVAPSTLVGPSTGFTRGPEPYAADSIFQFRPDRKFDVYIAGLGASRAAARIKPEILEASVRSLSAAELHPELLQLENVPSSTEVKIETGSARRRLASETRRFDLIQVVASDAGDSNERRFDSRAESALTVESLRIYLDRLKDDGFLQIVGKSSGARAQSVLATLAESWKKSARRDIDLHAVAVTSESGKVLETVILRMKPFLREERDKLGDILKVAKDDGMSWMLVSDASGAVLTDDRPFGGTVTPVTDDSRTVMWLAVVVVLGLIVWVAMQERRKGLASRWQTASVATYFGGLGVSFAFFQVFFVLRAIRGWGIPSMAMGLVLAALFFSRAAGATLFAGHPRRRYGVRIQPLANFVFAVMFTYLGAALFEPLVATGAEWLSAFVGMSVLIPFGLLGGAFLPNALEEASEKLAPRVLSLLWALYVAGTALGGYWASVVAYENGLDVVFLAGLFCFAWVAIFSGLVRPWNVRKVGSGGASDAA
jgi:hypothetical protein